MLKGNRSHKILLLLGYVFSLYLSLYLALIIRYLSFPSFEFLKLHLLPFTIINLLWLFIFYIAGFFDIEKKLFIGLIGVLKVMFVGGLVAVLFFYLLPYFEITPKINLFVDAIIASFLIWGWRKLFFKLLAKTTKTQVLFLGDSREMSDFSQYLNERAELGYQIIKIISEEENGKIEEIIKNNKIDLIVIAEGMRRDHQLVQMLYKILPTGVTVIDFNKFYEFLTGKVPVSLIGEAWFLENLMEINKQSFERFKRWLDIILAIFFGIVAIILFLIVGLLIKINSPGPVLYRQRRVGKAGKTFEVVKFRSMRIDAEKDGAQWAKENDERITFIGNILRRTRIDELLQVINVLKSDLSFVGPRPERPEFVKELTKKIPHYSMRNLVKPGLTGWAQINFPYGASIEDAMEKLQYDLYYIKNRNLGLDVSIFLKTIMIILQHSGR